MADDQHAGLPLSGVKLLGWFVLFVLVAIIVFYNLPAIGQELRLLRKVNAWWLLLAIAAQSLTYWLNAQVYLTLLHTDVRARVPDQWTMTKSCIISLFFNETVPSAGISGNAFMYRLLERFGLDSQTVFSLILSELIIFYAAMESFFLLLLAGNNFLYRVDNKVAIILLVGMGVYLLFGIGVVMAGKGHWMQSILAKLKKWRMLRHWQKNSQFTPMLRHGSTGVFDIHYLLQIHRRAVVLSYWWQLLVVAADAATIYTLSVGLGMPVHPIYCLLALAGGRIATLMPFLPGGLLLYEGTMGYFLIALGVPATHAVVITLLYRLLSFWLPIPIGLVLFRRWKKQADRPDAGVLHHSHY
ncbi:UPF0104 family protein [Paraflavitalea soli]|uniref:UPF0104 family protein n=1 Tax=Paraflavitalea soli TaxID=2315862 RepID=A0A3B7MRE8_9BACT|nr:lysylphosphatidylglycerol synthase transmembrane domain-containing protein [Paraflavitalea soli]AXY74185.1 UPF0104 family protein [Paraflavitalea soli]